MASFFESKELSISIFSLWRELLAEENLPPLDRWLKSRSKPLIAKKGKSRQAPPQPLVISAALMDGMRFMQLACWLEYQYQYPLEALDMQKWDQHWRIAKVKKVPMSHFWYWIELRVNGSEGKAPPQLRDKAQRVAFFAAQIEKMDDFANKPAYLMWHGLRPQWLELILERCRASKWNDGQLKSFIELQTQQPPIWLRPQRGIELTELQAMLRQQGVQVELGATWQLCAQGGKGVHTTEAHAQGLVEIQDLASQQIALTVDAKAGDKVWDCCAGAGGKSIAIASKMDNKGVLVATDLRGYKLEEVKRRAQRAEIHNIRSFPWNGEEALRLPSEVAQQHGFDWVLVDAPCSSAGTWRRNQDARWRFNPQDTAELVAIQQKILTHAAKGVRRGGFLVYATCSWQVSENEAQVEWFLANHSDYELVTQSLLGAPELNSDTMFVAKLRRKFAEQ